MKHVYPPRHPASVDAESDARASAPRDLDPEPSPPPEEHDFGDDPSPGTSRGRTAAGEAPDRGDAPPRP